MFQMGFKPENPELYRAYNFTISLTLIIVLLPFFVIISASLIATQGFGVFYRGPRLGVDKRTFQIYKFRTLCSRRAPELTRCCPLPKNANIETPLGKFLRETRLDELPQLFNILKGDMNICGPRPVRPEIAAIERTRIVNYDRRFSVKPGLVGPTQAYFGHGASKRVRARMNNRVATRPVSIAAELMLLARIGFSVFSKIIAEIARVATRTATGPGPACRPDIWLVREGGDWLCAVDAIGARRIEARSLTCAAGGETAMLYIRLRSGALRKAKILLSDSGQFGVFSYTAQTEFGEFIIERYALGLVVLPPKIGALPAVALAGPRTLTPARA